MIFYILVHLICLLWGVDTNFGIETRIIYGFISFVETVFELFLATILIIEKLRNKRIIPRDYFR